MLITSQENNPADILNDFVLSKRQKEKLQWCCDNPDKLPNLICLHGIHGQGKTSFASLYSDIMAKEVHYLDTNKIPDGGFEKYIELLAGTFTLIDDKAYFDKAIIIDEWQDFSAVKQNKFKGLFNDLRSKILIIICCNADENKRHLKCHSYYTYLFCQLA